MSPAANGLRLPGDDPTGALFELEARREGKIVVRLLGLPSEDGGVTVESHVFPPGHTGEGIKRPFPFQTREQANRFVEEATISLEYLNCTIVD